MTPVIDSRVNQAAASLCRLLLMLPGLLAGLVSPMAAAVHLSPDDTGQVILVPYYTARSGFVTSISIVNRNMDHAKAIKVRFREARIGASVMDMNLFLAPRDVWVASISDDGTGARISAADRSCTHPVIPAGGAAFTNRFYTGQAPGTFNDGGGDSLDRTRDGYIEIIEMGVIADGSDASASPQTESGRILSRAVAPTPEGRPRNCEAVRVANPFTGSGDLRTPAGELSADVILIQVETGTEFVVPATALQRFYVPTDLQDDLFTDPGSILPDLTSVRPARSDVMSMRRDDPLLLTVADWVAAGGRAVDAVSAVLMKSDFSTEYDVSGNQFRSELVVTMPTMRHYVLPETVEQRPPFTVRGPFAEQFGSPSGGVLPGDGSACNTFSQISSDREAAPYAFVSGGPSGFFSVCRAANRIVVVPSGFDAFSQIIFGVGPSGSLTLGANGSAGSAPQYSAGWINFAPTRSGASESALGPGQLVHGTTNSVSGRPVQTSVLDRIGGLGNIAPVHTDGIARRYRGLPVIGFGAIQAVVGGQGYGGIFRIKGGPNPAP